MKKLFRTISLIVFTLIAVCFIKQPVQAAPHQDFSLLDYTGPQFTDGYYTYVVVDNEAYILKADRSISGHVTIPSDLGGYPVAFIYGGSFRSCTAVTEVTVPDSVLTIGFNCFEDCTGLKTVNLGKNVTTFIGRAFAGCTALETVNWGPNVTTIGRENFYNCTALTSITIPDSVTTIDHSLFYYCENLESVKLSENLTDIPQSTFHDCYSLKSIVIPDSVQSIGNWAFAMPSMYVGQESKLESVVIGSGVKSIGLGAFYQCTALTTVTMNQSVEIIEDRAFVSCESLQAIHIPDTTVTIEEHAFDGCLSLAKVTLGNSIKTIGTCAFEDCAITEIIIPDSTTEIGNRAFYSCSNMVTAKIGANVEKIDLYAFAGCSSLKEIVIPDSVTYLGQNAFSSCTAAKTAYIGKGVTELREQAFYRCSSLESISVGEGITAIGPQVFTDCSSLTEIVVADENASYCSDSRGVLFDKNKTRLIQAPGAISGSYTVPDTVTAIGDHSFYNCKKLEKLAFPDSLKTIEGFAFYGCEGLEHIDYGNGLEEAPNSMTFAYCHKLTEVNLPDSFKTIGPLMYHGCAGLVNIEIADGVETIGAEAFSYCSNLKSVKLGKGVTNIQRSAFEFTEKLQEITICENLKTVGDSAFYRADSLTDVYYGGTVEQWADITIGANNERLIYANIHFPWDGQPLALPVLSTETDPLSGKPVITWGSVTGADKYEVFRSTSSKSGYKSIGTTPETAYTDETATAGKTYYYKVKAICEADDTLSSKQSAYKSAKCRYSQPVTEITNNSSGYPVIKWAKVKGAKKYDIYYTSTIEGAYKKLTSTSSTSYTHSKAASGKGYFYKVRAYGTSTSYASEYSDIVYGVKKLAKPSITVTTNQAAGSAKISWKKITGAKRYDLQLSINGGEFDTIAADLIATSYTHNGLVVGETYTYRLCALCDNPETTSDYSTEKSTYIKCAKPVLTTSNNESGKPVLSWSMIEGAAEYEIRMATSSKGTFKQLAVINGTTYIHNEATGGKTYYYKVRALDANGNSGDFCSYKSVVCDCETPVITEVTTNSSGYPMIKWGKVAGAKNYEVYYSTTVSGTYKKLTTTTSASYTYSKATMDQEYYFKVRAYGSSTSSMSDYSDAAMGLRKLAKPSITLTTSQTGKKITVKWKKVTNAIGYELQCSIDSGAFVTIANDTKLSFVHKDLAPGHKYIYRLRAISSNTKTSSDYCAEKSATIKVGKPTLSVSLSESGKPQLSWGAVEGATQYKVYYATSKKGTYKLVQTTDELSYIYEAAKKGKTCYFKVKAVDINGTTGDYSSVKSIKSK